MMKAVLIRDGHILMGLSHFNLDRLRADGLKGGILICGAEMGFPWDIFITAAENESAMLDAMRNKIGPDTKVHISDKLKQ